VGVVTTVTSETARRAARSGTGLIAVLAVVTFGAAPARTVESPRSIAWARLRNPILGYRDRAVKDPAVVWAPGRWQALFSSVTPAGQWRIGSATSADLSRWSPRGELPHDAAVEGEASPDVVPTPDGSSFVVTYQSFVHDQTGSQPKLYYRTTSDFRRYSPARPLGLELHPAAADRMIDAAVAWTPAGLLLGYKYGQTDGVQAFELARSSTGSLDGPWRLIGRPDISVYSDTIENYQFLHLGGGWQLLATSNRLDRPFLFTLAGDPTTPGGWLHWSGGRELHVPQERWNPGRGATGATYEHANCAFVVDRQPLGGHVYLVYADAPEVRRFGGAGHDQLALARSGDLVHWSLPPR
jgi:hypothetical protein